MKKNDAPAQVPVNETGPGSVPGTGPLVVKPAAAGQPLEGKVLPGSGDDGTSPFKPASGT